MPWDDLEQELQALGYGNQWSSAVQKLAQQKQVKDDSDLKRLKQWQAKNAQAFKAARKRWYEKRKEQTKHRVGKQACVQCKNLMTQQDLIGQNRLPGHCVKCRKGK